jgi:YVTN family beta-propeller protein
MKINLLLALSIPIAIIGVYLGVERISVSHDRTTQTISKSQEFDKATQQAKLAAELEKSAKSKVELRSATNAWSEAITLIKSVPTNSANYQLAQEKTLEYQRYYSNVKDKVKNTPDKMTLLKTIGGEISPKSVVYSGKGLIFAQNMMYRHTITVYNREYNLVKTIGDRVNLSDYGYKKFPGSYQGSPVEAAFSHDGKYAWVSNYSMYGQGFNREGTDTCNPSGNYDPSTLYRINTESLAIEKVIFVGSVPKYNAVTPDNRFVLVSNWCTWDLSVVDIKANKEIKRIQLGAYPRGIAIDSDSKKAYVAVMGSSDIVVVNLQQPQFALQWLRNIGNGPRHLNIDSSGNYLYASLNAEGNVAKIDLGTGKVLKKVNTGNAPRSTVLSDDAEFLYVVNYNSNTMSKVRTSDMKVVQTVNTQANPIGITYDPITHRVWVACYSGSIMVFQD